jgi:hypothetical protein
MTFGEYLSRPVSRTGVRAWRRIPFAGALACFFLLGGALGQTAGKPDPAKQATDKPDLSKEPTLYVVGYAHLDTEWRWEYPQGHQRIPSENHGRELRAARKVPALRF